MTQLDLKGLIIPNITPFRDDPNRTVDLERLDRVVDYLIVTQRADALIAVGTTGESTSLSHKEKEMVIRRTIEAANGRVPVIAGTGSANTDEAIALTHFAEECGAAAVLVVSPYYIRPDQAGLLSHFLKVARSTRLPVVLYNHPGRTGVSINVDTLIRLANAAENVAGVKDCPNNLALSVDLIRHARAELRRPFAILTGEDENVFVNLCLGADGAIAASGHLLGMEIRRIIEFSHNGRFVEARELQFSIINLTRMLFHMPSPAPLKAALDILGTHLGGPVRTPLVDATDELREKLSLELKRLNKMPS